jgi:hypothetical protein
MHIISQYINININLILKSQIYQILFIFIIDIELNRQINIY